MPVARVNGGVNQPTGPDAWFQSLPFVTRYWFGAALVLTIAGNMGVIPPSQLAYIWADVSKNLQLWRILTCFCFVGEFSFPTLITLYMLVSMSQQYEAGGPFNTGGGGGTADYIFSLMFAIVVMLATYPFMPVLGIFLSPFFARNLVYFVLYVWSKRHPTAQANIWGVPVPALYLPFAYLALSILIGAPWKDMVHGMVVGHFYYFLVDVVPQVYGRDMLATPQFLLDQFGPGEYRPGAVPREPEPARGGGGGAATGGGAAAGGGGGHNWGGGGRTLGRD